MLVRDLGKLLQTLLDPRVRGRRADARVDLRLHAAELVGVRRALSVVLIERARRALLTPPSAPALVVELLIVQRQVDERADDHLHTT